MIQTLTRGTWGECDDCGTVRLNEDLVEGGESRWCREAGFGKPFKRGTCAPAEFGKCEGCSDAFNLDDLTTPEDSRDRFCPQCLSEYYDEVAESNWLSGWYSRNT